ncbi:hypothetical protein Aduo_019104 [Ancylostoma duodenale]
MSMTCPPTKFFTSGIMATVIIQSATVTVNVITVTAVMTGANVVDFTTVIDTGLMMTIIPPEDVARIVVDLTSG